MTFQPTFANLSPVRLGLRETTRRMCCRIAAAAVLGSSLFGCATSEPELKYLGDKQMSYYKQAATTIDYPVADTQPNPEATFAKRPRTVTDRDKDEVWEVSLTQAIQLAIQNNSMIRTRADNRAASAILSAGDRAPSAFDPSIQETGVLFGSRGVAAALSAFDAQLSSSMTWGRNEVPQNNAIFGGGIGGGQALTTETGVFNSQLSKTFSTGGSFALGHSVNYTGNNIPAGAQLFQSAYTGNVSAQYLHPLLAGSGTEFTRIAGPVTQSFGGISGVTQGVVIARINQHLSLADF